MASSTIDLYKGADSSVSYTLQGTVGTRSSYIQSASSLRLPDALVVNHELKSAGSAGSDRHQVLKQLAAEDTSGKVDILSFNQTLAVPRNNGITDTMVIEQVAEGISFFIGNLTSGQVSKLTSVVANLIDGVTP